MYPEACLSSSVKKPQYLKCTRDQGFPIGPENIQRTLALRPQMKGWVNILNLSLGFQGIWQNQDLKPRNIITPTKFFPLPLYSIPWTSFQLIFKYLFETYLEKYSESLMFSKIIIIIFTQVQGHCQKKMIVETRGRTERPGSDMCPWKQGRIPTCIQNI